QGTRPRTVRTPRQPVLLQRPLVGRRHHRSGRHASRAGAGHLRLDERADRTGALRRVPDVIASNCAVSTNAACVPPESESARSTRHQCLATPKLNTVPPPAPTRRLEAEAVPNSLPYFRVRPQHGRMPSRSVKECSTLSVPSGASLNSTPKSLTPPNKVVPYRLRPIGSKVAIGSSPSAPPVKVYRVVK